MKNKLLLVIIFLGVIAGVAIGHSFAHKKTQPSKQVLGTQTIAQKEIAPTTSPTSSEPVAPGVPEKISIPKINVNTTVESVGMDSEGRMDIPKDPADTAWFSPGYKPGMNGSAVIDGHLDLVTGAPAVFWNLKLLSAGDNISVTENNGKTYTFAVTQTVRYPYNSFPIKEVFAASDVPMLNLITCNGTWDKTTKNYSDRLVVYSKLVSIN
ncbi:MAG TPA: class F sortase [Candidatus Saccharimonadales bacterium]|nr:class F sortase [Candidatus Saccharimonadales bacterium]